MHSYLANAAGMLLPKCHCMHSASLLAIHHDPAADISCDIKYSLPLCRCAAGSHPTPSTSQAPAGSA